MAISHINIGRLLVSIALAIILLTTANAQRVEVIQAVTTSATINATATVVVSTGTDVNLTLPTSPATGRTIRIVNHGTGNVLFSVAIKVSKDNSFDVLPDNPNVYLPYISTNTITIIWSGTNWVSLGH